jgi:hypothetical protein
LAATKSADALMESGNVRCEFAESICSFLAPEMGVRNKPGYRRNHPFIPENVIL